MQNEKIAEHRESDTGSVQATKGSITITPYPSIRKLIIKMFVNFSYKVENIYPVSHLNEHILIMMANYFEESLNMFLLSVELAK